MMTQTTAAMLFLLRCGAFVALLSGANAQPAPAPYYGPGLCDALPPASSFPPYFEGDPSGTNNNACTDGLVLEVDEKCDIKLTTGFVGDGGTTEITCAFPSGGCGCEDGTNFCNYDSDPDSRTCEPCDAYATIEDCADDGLPANGVADCEFICFYRGTLDYPTIQITGCMADFYQSAVPSMNMGEGDCTACAAGKFLATASFVDATTECSEQTLATIAGCCQDPTCAPSYDEWACIDALEATSAASTTVVSTVGMLVAVLAAAAALA